MKAFYIKEPGATELRDLSPPKLSPGELLLQPRLIGLCGTDLSTFRGKNPLVSYPRIPGHEIAATIVEAGGEVPPEFRLGLNVTLYPNTSCGVCASCKRGRTNACKFNQTLGVQRDGAMAGLFTIPWQKVVEAPRLSLRELVLVEPLAVGFHAVERGRVTGVDTVAVIGCGTVGLGALAAAASRNATTIAIDLDENKLALAKQAGARYLVHSRDTSLHDDLSAITDGLGPDVVIEAVGTAATYRMAVEEVAHTGRVVYIGWVKDPVSFETSLFVHKELDVLGSRNYLNEFPAVIEVLARGDFPVEAAISATVPLASAGDALREWSESPQKFTKILVDMDAGSR
ncbi:MAG TPA: zinc-binding alcohol dehydrogenase family protein [Bryobacteraceae bacterium]|nr:zinc-binding alcohol dehydrogenase family protein [Bryobacteraceae bacterium]